MPYCPKCGTELDKDAKFCPKCGTPSGQPVVEPRKGRKKKRPISTLAIVLIALIIIAAVIATIAIVTFLPVQTVGPVTWQMSVPSKSGINTLNLDLNVDVAKINIAFEDLTDEWQSPSITLDASATARVGVFGSADVLDRFMPVWQNTTSGDALTVTVTQELTTVHWPGISSLNVTFDIRINSYMNTSLDIRTGTGGIVLDTQAGVVLNSLSLEATTGGVEANLAEDVVIAGDISLETTTGGVEFTWDNVIITQDVLVNAITTTGGVDVDIKQSEERLGNVTLDAEATTGGVEFAIDIQGDVGAKIESSVTTGGIDIIRKVGFSGTTSSLQSNNYPDSSNFDVSLRTTTGGIDIDAKYTP